MRAVPRPPPPPFSSGRSEGGARRERSTRLWLQPGWAGIARDGQQCSAALASFFFFPAECLRSMAALFHFLLSQVQAVLGLTVPCRQLRSARGLGSYQRLPREAAGSVCGAMGPKVTSLSHAVLGSPRSLALSPHPNEGQGWPLAGRALS